MFEIVKNLILSKDVCVLATINKDRPHCSLMAYVAEEDCRRVYMATRSDTRKWSNLQDNPYASILIDSRGDNPAPDRIGAKALTISGRNLALGRDERTRAEMMLANKHAHLAEFLQDPLVGVICVECESFLLLEGVSKSHYIEVPKKKAAG